MADVVTVRDGYVAMHFDRLHVDVYRFVDFAAHAFHEARALVDEGRRVAVSPAVAVHHYEVGRDGLFHVGDVAAHECSG